MNATLTIDNFSVAKGVSWTPLTPIVSVNNQRAYDGTLHVSSLFVPKDNFHLQINNVSQSQLSILQQIYSNITTVLHTVYYCTPLMQRVWDGTTANNGIVNADNGRIRNKCFISSFTFTNYEANPDVYQVDMNLEES